MFFKRKSKIWAIVPSAGSGRRMQQSIPKQYLELQGRSVIEHTLATLLAEERVKQLTVCIAQADEFWNKLDIASQSRVTYTLGGATRAQSVFNGIEAISKKAKKDDWVLVHDAARPCLSISKLATFIDELADEKVGGILALPSNDTVKLAFLSGEEDSNEDGAEPKYSIEKTLDRDKVWYAQTPQMFRFEILKESLQQAIESGTAVTDEASAVELAGHTPRLIDGERRNIKITRSEDLEMAESLMTQERSRN